jgi:hypothetical protein
LRKVIETDGSYPSATELFHVAGLLARGTKISKSKIIRVQQIHSFALNAILLWEECSSLRNGMIDKTARTYLFANKALQKARELPAPRSYPVSLDEFLRLVMPTKRAAERMNLYREYLRLSIRVQNQYLPTGTAIPFQTVPIPSDDEVSKLIDMLRTRQFNEEQYKNYAGWFLNTSYLKSVEAENRKKRAKAGAAALKIKREQDAKTKEN